VRVLDVELGSASRMPDVYQVVGIMGDHEWWREHVGTDLAI
jgi:hypothetical protein